MRKVFASALIVSLFALGGCAADPTYTASRAKVADGEEQDVLTGTRIPRPTTERVVKHIGNKDYKDEQIKSMYNDSPKGAN